MSISVSPERGGDSLVFAYHQLSNPHKALSQSAFEDLGPVDVLCRRFVALFVVDVFCHNACYCQTRSSGCQFHMCYLLLYMMLKKNSMAETALRSSCLATNGHSIQLMRTAATTPTTNARPRLMVMATGDPPSVTKVSDVTVNDRHPTRPDLCFTVSSSPIKPSERGVLTG